ncbi:MAG: TonB-dependent receptor [Ignavibacteria bacterium]|nr:TonB-dependent receptor [Ignavibacteria bacterium]
MFSHRYSKSLIFCLILFVFINITNNKTFAQTDKNVPTQSIKGEVLNYKTQQPLSGVRLFLADTKFGTFTKKDGSFKIPNVPAGRYTFKATSIGYESFNASIVVTSGKELQIFVQLDESYVKLDSVLVTAEKNKFNPINETALVSSAIFSTDDVQRFAGSRMDPARMAQNFAGVLGANDLRNDIIIRGGSPTELLWRIDGLDIPNPNHFATQGATGGPVSALNSNLLDFSDFITGAFPAEYGNKLSGVFDLHTKKGNQEKYEFLGQFGFNGFELGAEGPIPLDHGSFIIDYRYSFLDLMDKMGFKFGFAGIPRYQDCMIKSDFNLDETNRLAFTALLGTSSIFIDQAAQDTVRTGDFNIKNGSTLYSVGLNWKHLFSEKMYSNLLAGAVYTKYFTDIDSIHTIVNDKVDNLSPWFSGNSVEGYYTLKYNLNYSYDSWNFLSAGIETRWNFFDLNNRRLTVGSGDIKAWSIVNEGNAGQILGFVNWNWRISEDLTSNVGFHTQYFGVNKKMAIEPRLSLSYKLATSQSFNAGFGIHSQSLPLVLHFDNKDSNDIHDKNLDFMKSIHYIVGYAYQLAEDAMFKVEGYYKDLSQIPVESNKLSSWSFINSGASFGSVDQKGYMKSTGVGRTYGFEASFIKNFANGYYITATGSYVRQQYKGSDDIWRFGAFDNIFILNLLAGYEWVISPAFMIEFSGKYTTAGGSPYTPVDIDRSYEENRTYYLDKEAFTLRNPDYGRFDIRIDFRNNFKSFAITSYVSAENMLNQKNILLHQYSTRKNEVEAVNQLGFFFVGGFKIEF